jgi:4-oxalomesaconate tautomerase
MGQLRSDLAYGQVEEILKDGLHEFLDSFQLKLNAVGTAIHETFVAMPAEQAPPLRARDLGITGYETPKDLDANTTLKAKIESIRLSVGPRMNLGDVKTKVVPKMSLIAPARAGGHVCTRTFIPHDCHAAIGVLGAVSVATACILPASVTQGIATVPDGTVKQMSVEHPTGEFSVTLEVGGTREQPEVRKAGLLRTARLILRGEVLVPAAIWDGRR